ncbi:MAG: hypothetical protein JWM24_1139, partial [Solirubrobacterales bacterium]|nr:hypothetical protein [Solirubrobacterales bacterium]
MRHHREKGTQVTRAPHAFAILLTRLFGGARPTQSDAFQGSSVSPSTSSHARARALVCAVSCGALALFALAPSAASAKQIRLFAGTFGAATSTPANPYPLSGASAGGSEFGPATVAVDQKSGDVYVADQGNRRIEKFDSAGNFLLMFGKDVNQTTGGNVCTIASGDKCQAGADGSAPGEFHLGELSSSRTPFQLFLAVDNSSGPSQGDIYVADAGNSLITKFEPSGAVVSSWGDNGPAGAANGQLNSSAAIGQPVVGPFANPEGTVEGPFKSFDGIATDSSGNLWVAADDKPHIRVQVFKFKADSSFLTVWGSGTSFDGIEASVSEPAGIAVDSEDNVYLQSQKYTSSGHWIGQLFRVGGTAGLAVDAGSGDLYDVVDNGFVPTSLIQRYASCEPFQGGHVCTPTESFGAGRFPRFREGLWGLAIDPSTAADTLYASVLRGEVATFAVRTVPDVTTVKASAPTPASTTLNGTVDPAGQPLTECFFEWGEGGEPYEHKAACQPNAAEVGSGSIPVSVHATISALQAGKTYHFRLVAANANDVNGFIDEPSLGADLAFGPPILVSSSAAAVSSTAATLQARVNPNGVDTHLRFEYGLEAGVYDHSLPLTDLGSASAELSASRPIQGLSPQTTYHYRVLVENAFGALAGEDHAFTTQGVAAPGLPDARAWELVSPPDKNGTPLEAISQEGGHIQAAADGSGLAYISKGPIDPEPAGNRSVAMSQLLARRSATGWSTQDIATPHQAPVGIGPGHLSEYRIFSSDLSLGALEPEGATPLSPEA